MRLIHAPAPRAEVGAMTAAMRAAAPARDPARALRVALVVAGRIVEERLFRERRRVDDLAADGMWFDVERGAFVLCTRSGAVGHALVDGARVALGPEARRVRLDESARGKVVAGKVTVLFQLVAPPPRAGKAALPVAVQRRAIDWPLTMIAAFSFLVHFGVVGAMFSDWMDPVVGDEAAIVGLVDLRQAGAQPIAEDASAETSAGAGTRTNASARTSARPSASTRPSTRTSTRAESLAREGEAMKMDLLATLGTSTAVDGALRRGDVPVGDLDRVARESGGVLQTGGELSLAPDRKPAYAGVRSLASLGDGRGTMHDGREREPDGPKVDVAIAQVPVTGFHDVDISGTIARLRPSFRSCYVRKGLDRDSTMEGKVTIDVAIAPNGDVAGVTKVDGAGLSAAVEQCIMDRARVASFPAPGGSGAHARVPILFRRQP